jgi:hypothetical protein
MIILRIEVTSDRGADGATKIAIPPLVSTPILVVKQWSPVTESSKLHWYKTCELTCDINLETIIYLIVNSDYIFIRRKKLTKIKETESLSFAFDTILQILVLTRDSSSFYHVKITYFFYL